MKGANKERTKQNDRERDKARMNEQTREHNMVERQRLGQSEKGGDNARENRT